MLKWGVIGVGRAGLARAQAMHQDPRADPRYGLRGNPASVGLREVNDYAEVLRRVDAVAICTPDNTHADLVRLALTVGCHVVVEFPLAGSAEVARDLLRLAERHERVLHVEHIELLSGTARVVREACAGLTLVGGALGFTGKPRRSTYGVASANVARLHRLVDAVGLPDGVQCRDRGPRHFKGGLRFGDAQVELDFRQGEQLPRSTWLRLELDDEAGQRTVIEQRDGTVTQDGRPLVLPPGPSLFLQDQLAATARILDGAEPYLPDSRVIGVLSLVDALVRASPEGGFSDWVVLPPHDPADEAAEG